MCLCVYVCGSVHATAHMWRSNDSCGNLSPPFFMWVQRSKLKSSGTAVSTFTCQALSTATGICLCVVVSSNLLWGSWQPWEPGTSQQDLGSYLENERSPCITGFRLPPMLLRLLRVHQLWRWGCWPSFGCAALCSLVRVVAQLDCGDSHSLKLFSGLPVIPLPPCLLKILFTFLQVSQVLLHPGLPKLRAKAFNPLSTSLTAGLSKVPRALWCFGGIETPHSEGPTS